MKGALEKVIQTSSKLRSEASSSDGMQLKASEENYFEKSAKSLLAVSKISLEIKDERNKDDTKTDDKINGNTLKPKISKAPLTLRGFTIRNKNL